jgi:hypothetical protein
MHKSRKRLIIMSIVSVLLIIGFIPKISEKTITENSEYVLNTHHYSKISEYGDYSFLFDQKDYIVRNNITNEIDTLGVTSVRGQLLLSEKIEVKKNRIKNIFF